MDVKRYIAGIFQTNTYMLTIGDDVLLIDPASKPEKMIEELGDKNLLGILLTHGHLDHIKAVDGLVKKYNCPVYINKEDERLARDKSQGIKFGMNTSAYVSSEMTHLHEGKMKIGPFEFEVIFTPGHTKGSVCYKFEKEIFTGDTLFRLSAGRTDLDSGSESDLNKSMNILRDIKENLIVYPGHEESSTLDFEKENNIYLN